MSPISNIAARVSCAGNPWSAMRPCDEQGTPLFEDTYRASAISRTAPGESAESSAPGSAPSSSGVPEASTVGAAMPGPLAAPIQVLLMGPPGSGKSTQGKLLSERYGVPHISTGDLLRAESESGTERGDKIKAIIGGGDMIPSDMMYAILDERLSAADCQNGFILDGFPRNFEQVPMWRALRRDHGFDDFLVVGLQVSDDVTRERLSKRGRDDDTPETIEHRLKVYHQDTQPVIEFFDSQGEYFGVDGTGTVEEINQRLQQVIDTPPELRPRR